MSVHGPVRLDRRTFLRATSRSALGVALGGAAATLAAACGDSGDQAAGAADAGATPSRPDGGGPGSPSAGGPDAATPTDGPRPIVGDVMDFALTSDEWAGAFGFVTLRMRPALVDGAEAFMIRTDASDEAFAAEEGLVFVPRLRVLAGGGGAAAAYVFDEGADGQHVVLSTEPGRDDYTPAFELHRVTWDAGARRLASADEVRRAEQAGELSVEPSGIVVNAPMVVWSSGRLPTDDELTDYLGPGQLIGEPDIEAMQVTFKLHECFPGSRYIVTDTSAPPMAEGMRVAAGPGLAGASGAGATGRVNVLMGGLEGPGPMGSQPSVFDSQAGAPAWSPYWDHLTYVWRDGADARVLEDEAAIHAARDAGDLEEFVGTPDTGGQGFVVNCPVPVVAPNTFPA